MVVAMIAATSAFGQQKLFNATELNRAKADTAKVADTKPLKRSDRTLQCRRVCEKAVCDTVICDKTVKCDRNVKCDRACEKGNQDCCVRANVCPGDSVCPISGKKIKPVKKGDQPLKREKVLQTSKNKTVEKK